MFLYLRTRVLILCKTSSNVCCWQKQICYEQRPASHLFQRGLAVSTAHLPTGVVVDDMVWSHGRLLQEVEFDVQLDMAGDGCCGTWFHVPQGGAIGVLLYAKCLHADLPGHSSQTQIKGVDCNRVYSENCCFSGFGDCHHFHDCYATFIGIFSLSQLSICETSADVGPVRNTGMCRVLHTISCYATHMFVGNHGHAFFSGEDPVAGLADDFGRMVGGIWIETDSEGLLWLFALCLDLY